MDFRKLVIRFKATPFPGGMHLVTDEREHDTDGTDCWCRPRYFRPCDDCVGNRGCWKCDGGIIHFSRHEVEGQEEMVVLHNGMGVFHQP